MMERIIMYKNKKFYVGMSTNLFVTSKSTLYNLIALNHES